MPSDNKKNIIGIKSEINSIKKSVLNFNFQKSTGQLDKTSNIRKAKRKIAVLKTKLNQEKKEKNA
tara:strand:+ start:8018 stop:8212 length:195 start_codon:yes stop_codon:yes gene_type:complete